MMMEHLGIRWGYVFLRASNYLSSEEFNGLMLQAVEMYLGGESERKVKETVSRAGWSRRAATR